MTSARLAEVLERDPLLPVAWAAASTTATFLRDERPHALATSTKSGPTDVVTHMDKMAEERIVQHLLAQRPHDGLLGEEGVNVAGTTGVHWIIDPLDGTVNYLYRLPDYAVSIAAQVDGLTHVGVIVTPESDEAFMALRGHGAWRIQRGVATSLHASTCTDLSSALIATGFAYDPAVRREQGHALAGLLGQVRDMRYSGAATVELVRVASGQTDAFYLGGMHPWDYAAGLLIAEEAGAAIATPFGDPGLFTIASSPGIVERLLEIVSP